MEFTRELGHAVFEQVAEGEHAFQLAARAELIALATDVPPDVEPQTKVGTLPLEVAGYDDGSISSEIDHLGWLRLAIRNVVPSGQKQFR